MVVPGQISRSAAAKRLVAVEVGESGHQHEMNGVQALKSLLGDPGNDSLRFERGHPSGGGKADFRVCVCTYRSVTFL